MSKVSSLDILEEEEEDGKDTETITKIDEDNYIASSNFPEETSESEIRKNSKSLNKNSEQKQFEVLTENAKTDVQELEDFDEESNHQKSAKTSQPKLSSHDSKKSSSELRKQSLSVSVESLRKEVASLRRSQAKGSLSPFRTSVTGSQRTSKKDSAKSEGSLPSRKLSTVAEFDNELAAGSRKTSVIERRSETPVYEIPDRPSVGKSSEASKKSSQRSESLEAIKETKEEDEGAEITGIKSGKESEVVLRKSPGRMSIPGIKAKDGVQVQVGVTSPSLMLEVNSLSDSKKLFRPPPRNFRGFRNTVSSTSLMSMGNRTESVLHHRKVCDSSSATLARENLEVHRYRK